MESLDDASLLAIGLIAVIIGLLALRNPMQGWGTKPHDKKDRDSRDPDNGEDP